MQRHYGKESMKLFIQKQLLKQTTYHLYTLTNQKSVKNHHFAIITGQFHVGKIIEKLMHQRLNQFLEDNECFYPH